MSYRIELTAKFEKQSKRLSKKYPSVKSDLAKLGEELKENPTLGTPLGRNCFKIRMAITSKGKGKSGGARVITHIYVAKTTVYLLSVYDKSEQGDIEDKELDSLLSELPK